MSSQLINNQAGQSYTIEENKLNRLKEIVELLRNGLSKDAPSASLQPLTQEDQSRADLLNEIYTILSESQSTSFAETATGETITVGMPAANVDPHINLPLSQPNILPHVILTDYVDKIEQQQSKFDQHFSRADQQHYRLEEQLAELKVTHTEQMNSHVIAYKQLLLHNESMKKQVDLSTEHVQRLTGHLESCRRDITELQNTNKGQQEELFNARRDLADANAQITELQRYQEEVSMPNIKQLNDNLCAVQIENCKLLVENSKLAYALDDIKELVVEKKIAYKKTLKEISKDNSAHKLVIDDLKEENVNYKSTTETMQNTIRRLEQAMLTVEKQAADTVRESIDECARLKIRVKDSENEKISLMQALDMSQSELSAMKSDIFNLMNSV